VKSLPKPTVRDSRIPCRNCNKGTLFWNSEEGLYVCTQCGIQEAALDTWIDAAQYREQKRMKKKNKERQWALEILGVKDQLNKPIKSKKEKDWEEIIDKIENKE
jgi:transcription initiation factor TFIIIB Brf1 subunit/transcription initiation factor TFIIB